MNFLAHIYLSGENQKIQIGNFMADTVKGSKFNGYPKEIQLGIKLHRQIDSYTDAHPITKSSTKILKPKFGRYSGIIVDIFYDHFLAKNWNNFHKTNFRDYTTNFYNLLENNTPHLTQTVINFLPIMIQQDWIYSYKDISGIESIMQGMTRRIKNRVKMYQSIKDLEENYTTFEEQFNLFFPELQKFSNETLETLKNEL